MIHSIGKETVIGSMTKNEDFCLNSNVKKLPKIISIQTICAFQNTLVSNKI